MEEERRDEEAQAEAESEQIEDLEPRDAEAEDVKGGAKLNDLQ